MTENISFKAAGWAIAAIAAAVAGLFVFSQWAPDFRPLPDRQKASIPIFRAKAPVRPDSGPPKYVNPVTPQAEESAPRATAEISGQPPAVEHPEKIEKLPIPQVSQPQATTPPARPAAPQKSEVKNTIYRERWLLDQDSSFYTLQLLGVRDEESLLNFVKSNKLLEKKNIAYYQSLYKGKRWYPLLYGVYPAKSDAKSAVSELPDKVRNSIPWIRKISAVQKEIRAEAERIGKSK